jgi:hypothetical protein
MQHDAIYEGVYMYILLSLTYRLMSHSDNGFRNCYEFKLKVIFKLFPNINYHILGGRIVMKSQYQYIQQQAIHQIFI